MELTVDWRDPLIPEEDVLALRPNDLDDFYAGASDWDKNNVFFVLLNTLHKYEDKHDAVRAGHLCFLIANYLFVALTPPGSYDLALHYMGKALAWNPMQEYRAWYDLMEKGN